MTDFKNCPDAEAHADILDIYAEMVRRGERIRELESIIAEICEKAEPVAWRSRNYAPWLNGGYAWSVTFNPDDVREYHEPLYLHPPHYTIR